MQRPQATILMDNGAKIVIELYPEQAPNTVNSFIWLARRGCYDNYAIQRIVPGWVADMSYTAFGREDCKYLIPNESRCQGVDNTLPMDVGSVGMGGYAIDEISGGEFFFPLAYSKKLDGRYPAFGLVRSGLEEVMRWERVELVPVEPAPGLKFEINRPVQPLIIRSVQIETWGVNYDEPGRLRGHELPYYWRQP